MKIGISVIGYNRPRYLERCLAACSKQTVPVDIAVFIDGPPSEVHVECLKVAGKYSSTIKSRPTNAGIPLQWYDALETVNTRGLDAVIVLEDDVIVEPLYVEAIQSMISEYTDPRIAFVSSFPDKVQTSWPLLPWTTGDHLLGVAITAGNWNKIKPIYKKFMCGDIITIEGPKGKNPTEGQDVALYTAMAHLGQVPLFSRHRLARYIGEKGMHGTPRDFIDKQWAKLPVHDHYLHPPMNEWWLGQAIDKIKQEYGDPK